MFLKMIAGTLQPYSFQQLRADHPDTSFPEAMSSEDMVRYGLEYAPVEVSVTAPVVGTAIDVRSLRNTLLQKCDWTQLPDAQLEAEAREVWVQYRQLLRDITTQPGFPEAVQWPAVPTTQE